MKDEVKRDRDQQNGRDLKSKDRRNRSPRRDRSRSPVDRRNKKDSDKTSRRVYVANISFDTRWSEVKDFFREKIGNVTYCQMFEDEEGRSRGCGLIEFQDSASAKRAIDELHKYNFKGRDLVVKEDIDCERDRYGRLITSKKEKEHRDSDHNRYNRQIYDPMAQNYTSSFNNTYGLSPSFLESLNIRGPLNNRIFVANLDYNVGEKKLEEIFRLAGKVLRVRLYKDHKDASRGYATVEFEHPVEAVQAISMFNDQNLYGRPMSIRMDKYETEEMPEVLPSKLPSGLESIGKGLGVGGQPLNIGKSLLNAANQASAQASLASQNVAPLPVPQPAPTVAAQQVNSYSLSGLTNQLGQPQGVVGINPNLATQQVNQALANTSLSSLSSLGNLNVSSLTGLNNQNLTQLANTAQNVLNCAASLGNNSMNPSMSQPINPTMNASMNPSLSNLTTTTQNNLFTGYDRDYQADKYRNGNQSLMNPMQNPPDKVMVRNLPQNYSWQELKSRFQEIGEIRFCDIKNRGTGIIYFNNYQDANRAVSRMNGSMIENKQIEVQFCYN